MNNEILSFAANKEVFERFTIWYKKQRYSNIPLKDFLNLNYVHQILLLYFFLNEEYDSNINFSKTINEWLSEIKNKV